MNDHRLFVNGDIHTMDPDHPRARSLLCRDGRIVAVDPPSNHPSGGDAADVVDLEGRTVVPGFIDAHCHLELTTTHLSYAVQCFAPPHRSIVEICDTLRKYAHQVPEGGWLVGRADFGLHQFVEEQRPISRQDLDAAVPDIPTVVYSGMHVCTLNTAGLKASGLLDGAQLPQGSSVDIASGRGLELAHWLPNPNFGVDATAEAIHRLGTEMFAARGVTTVTDIIATRDGVRAYQALHRDHRLPCRIDLRYHSPTVLTARDLAATGLESGFGDEWLRIGGIKLFIDGAGHDLAGSTIVDLKWTQSELDAEVEQAHRAGLQLMMHVQSTEAVDMALGAVDRAQTLWPREDCRHRLEHAGDMPVDHNRLTRMRALGVIPVGTAQFLYSYADAKPDVNQPPLRTLQDWGFKVPGNSDSTGSQPEAANPFHGIWCAMTRTTRLGKVLSPDERLDLQSALRMYTADAAYACHLPDRGALAPGLLADFVVLGADPFSLSVDELPAIPIDMVSLGGHLRSS
jgi:predicted amidohydrolase YtcJ